MDNVHAGRSTSSVSQEGLYTCRTRPTARTNARLSRRSWAAGPPTLDPYTLGYRITAAPAYHAGTLYVGAALSEGHIPGGLVIATDARPGHQVGFNTIPQRPQDDGWEIAADTWGDSQRAGGGVWTQPAINLDLGLIYFNTGNPSPDYDGSARPGANLFTNATVALDIETGALRWYYQAIHRDLWHWDHVTGPVLFDALGADGEVICGVGSAGKNCLLHLWDRETGDPINPMVETPVPTESNVAGEVVYPTQPIPYNARGVLMTPFCATYVYLDDPELQAQSRQMLHAVLHRGALDSRSRRIQLRPARVQLAHRALYVTGKNAAVSIIVRPLGDSLEPGPHGDGHSANFEEWSRIPAYTPTTTLTAYEPAIGEEAWQAVFPALTPIGAGGNPATADDLVFQGADDRAFCAFHAATGEQLFHHQAPRPIRSSPMTCQVNGKQCATVIATNTILTFALP